MDSTTDQGWRADLSTFQQSITALDKALTLCREGDALAVEDACELLVRLSNLKTQLALIYDDQAKFLVEKMNDKEAVTLSTGEMVEKKWSKDRKGWQHKDLASIVASRIENLAVDMDTGERVLTTTEMITKLLDFVQPSYWRVTALNEIGVNADDYCEAGESKPSISIRKAK